MNPDPSYPNVTLSFPLIRRERTMILRALDQDDQEARDLVNRFRPNEPLVLTANELACLAGTLTEKALRKSKPGLLEIAERMDLRIGQECPAFPKDGDVSDRDSEHRRFMQQAFAFLSGTSTLAELNAARRPKPDRSVYLVPDFAAMERAFRKAAQ